MKAIEKEIEFFKEISGRLTTALFLTLGATVATIKHYGFEVWAFVGALTSVFIAIALFLTVVAWRKKIEELKRHAENGD